MTDGKSQKFIEKAGSGEGRRGGVVVGHTKSGKAIYKHDKPSHRYKERNDGFEALLEKQDITLSLDGEEFGVVHPIIAKFEGEDVGLKMARDPKLEKQVMSALAEDLIHAEKIWKEVGGGSAKNPIGVGSTMNNEFDAKAYEKAGHFAYSAARNHVLSVKRQMTDLAEEVKGRRDGWERERNIPAPLIL